jgi:hypothetical protein
VRPLTDAMVQDVMDAILHLEAVPDVDLLLDPFA